MRSRAAASSSDFAHVGVQIDPEAHSLSRRRARPRSTWQSYFGTGRDEPRIDIYWGSAADFLNELRISSRRAEAGGSDGAGVP